MMKNLGKAKTPENVQNLHTSKFINGQPLVRTPGSQSNLVTVDNSTGQFDTFKNQQTIPRGVSPGLPKIAQPSGALSYSQQQGYPHMLTPQQQMTKSPRRLRNRSKSRSRSKKRLKQLQIQKQMVKAQAMNGRGGVIQMQNQPNLQMMNNQQFQQYYAPQQVQTQNQRNLR